MHKTINNKDYPMTPEDIAEYTLRQTSALERFKNEKVRFVKELASEKILAIASFEKQTNLSHRAIELLWGTKNRELTANEKAEILSIKAAKELIDAIRAKSNFLEDLINSKTSIAEVEAIDINDEIYWI